MTGSQIEALRAELAELDRIAAGPGGLTSAGLARRERVRELLRDAVELEASLPPELREENLRATPPAAPPSGETVQPPAPELPAPKSPPGG